MESYNTFIFDGLPQWDKVPVARISSFHWEKEKRYRPDSFAKLCAVREVGFFARLWSFEDSPKAEHTKRDSSVYQDSCLELFLKPLSESNKYINIECNSKATFLAQLGENRNERVFIKDLTDISPSVMLWTPEPDGKKAWGVEIMIPNELISVLYNVDFKLVPCEIKGNFYKCGDLTEIPHYAAYFPVDSMEAGFHNPDRFGSINLK